MKVDLATRLGDIELVSPIMTAAGTSGHGAELSEYFDLGKLGAIVVKSLAAFPVPGNPAPRLAPVVGGMLNSVGLQGGGVTNWIEQDLPGLAKSGATVICSIWGRTVEEYGQAARLLSGVGSPVVAVEINVSCPNVEDRHRLFAHSAAATADVLRATEPCGKPRLVKLSPGTSDLVEVASAALEAGAAGLVLTNTLFGMSIDVNRRTPSLGAGGGGLSGRALHPVAVRAVYDCRASLPDAVIVGVGGIFSGLDAIEMLMAGANAVQVGTATLANPRAPMRVQVELERWCKAHLVTKVSDIVSAAHHFAD